MKSLLSAVALAVTGAFRWLGREASDPARAYTFGANFFSTQITNLKAAPPVRVRVQQLHGRIRYALGLFPATNPSPQVADQIFFVRLPKGVLILGHLSQLSWSVNGAAATLTVGDSASTNRHLAATSINAAATAVPDKVTKNTGTVGYTTTDDTRDGTGVASATNDCDLLGVVAGAAVDVAQLIALHMAYVQD